jgi:hypothetical protein
MNNKTVLIDYTNWRGERRLRRIRPTENGLRFTKNQFHTEPQWLLTALDESGHMKTFAMANIHSWQPVK